ncbi:hypothetical protein NCC49_002237 [Naganishia albida]|nr:hypothetical protein NCC49_002237 [Naganishia albida]
MTITPDAKQDSAAPPSYAAAVAGAGPSTQQQPPQARTHSPSNNEQSNLRQAHNSQRAYHAGRNAEEQWMPPSSESEVRSRTRKRFFIAALWAFGIYTLLGLLIGGTVEDARSAGRHHRHSGRHNPQRPIDDAPPMDPHPHRKPTWHKITPTPTLYLSPTQYVEQVPPEEGVQEVTDQREIRVDELE